MDRRRAWIAVALAATFAVVVAPAPAAPGDEVLVIGDSLGVGMEPFLAQELLEYDVRTEAVIGRGSVAAVDELVRRESAADDVIVFALGSNDDPSQPEQLAASLLAANDVAAGRCLVVATLEVSGYTGKSDDPLNDVIRSFAANPNVRLVDWEAAVTPGMLTDGGHATAEGYALRASLFADAIESCDASPPDGGDGIPNPDRDAPAGRPDRPKPARERPEPVSRDEAIEILADALSSQIAIGVLAR